MRRQRQQGLSLLELAIAVAAVGALGLLVSQSYLGTDALRARQRAAAELEQGQQALLAFMLSHHRLPCPDLDGDRREGDAAGTCPADARSGWLPAETLGLALQGAALPRYAVSRDAGADLVAPPSLTGDDPANGHAALLRALANAAAQPLRPGQPFLTGDGAALGSVDCAMTRTANPAFVLLAAATDRNGDGGRFDGPHAGYDSAPGLCFAPPSLPLSASYDDVVQSRSAESLLGWLRSRTR